MKRLRDWLKRNPKLTGALGAAALAAGAYYGLPPEYSQPILDAIGGLLLGQ